MKKKLLISIVTLYSLVPIGVQAQTTQQCAATWGTGWVWDGSACVNSSTGRTTTQNPIVVNPNASTGASPARNGNLTYTALEPLPGAPDRATDLPTLLSAVFRLLITFGGLFAVVMLTVAGIGYMLAETPVKIDAAKDRAKAAVWGLLLLTMCWLILYTINPNLLRFDIFQKGVPGFNGGTTNQPSGGANTSSQTAAQINQIERDCAGRGVVRPDPQTNQMVCWPTI